MDGELGVEGDATKPTWMSKAPETVAREREDLISCQIGYRTLCQLASCGEDGRTHLVVGVVDPDRRSSILPGRRLAPPVLDPQVDLSEVLLADPVPVPNDNLDRLTDPPLPHFRLELRLTSHSLDAFPSSSPDWV